MIFTVRQILEKSHEHRAKFFLLFVDLKKACDSVPRAALWIALQKLGIPDSVITLIRSFHDCMKAQIRVNGDLLEDIDVDNRGILNGSHSIQPLCLFGGREMERESCRCRGGGIVWNYKLFRRYIRNARETELTECQFADDAAILVTTRVGAQLAMREFSSVVEDF